VGRGSQRIEVERPQARRARRERRRVDCDGPARTRRRDQYAGRERAEDLARRQGACAQGIGRLQLFRRDYLGHQRRRGRVEESGGGAGQAGEQGQRPHLRRSRDEQRRGGALARHPDEIGGDHDRAPRGPVRDDAADQHGADKGQRRAGEHEADRRGGAAHLEHGERERDGDHAVAEHGHALAEEEQPEAAQAEDPEAVWQARQNAAG
jgi:hypothetical protein